MNDALKAILEERLALEERERADRDRLLADHRKRYLEKTLELRRRCAEIGHGDLSHWHHNGLGRMWRACLICDAIVEERYYEI